MFKTSDNTKILALGIFAVLAIFMITGPLAQTINYNTAFAKSKDKSNESDQGISEKQSSDQNSQCVSGQSIVLSCNNLSAQNQANDGDNTSGQEKGGKGGNDADQENKQEQGSDQNSQCVTGGSIVLSCNNLSAQNQANDGDNTSGQEKGGKGGNDADQENKQEQGSDQNSQCVSGRDAIVSCNNAEFQNLVNSGNNALGEN